VGQVENRQEQSFDDLLDRAAEALRRAPVPQGPPLEAIARVLQEVPEGDVIPLAIMTRIRTMKRLARIAVAASVLMAVGLLVSWLMMGGGSTNLAFADVVKALANVRTATFDHMTEVKNPWDGKQNTYKSKIMFLAPSRERSVDLGSANDEGSISITDYQTWDFLELKPKQKRALALVITDGDPKIKQPAGTPSSVFETVRQIFRGGGSFHGGKVESLGKKEIDGREVVGFRAVCSNTNNITLWADPQTARPVRVEYDSPPYHSHSVFSNFRYNMELDPSLFSLEPPAGYSVQSETLTMPIEEDLVNILRLVAEHNHDTFPAAIVTTNKEVVQATQAAIKSEAEWMKMVGPLTQKLATMHSKGSFFYEFLKPENDSHYVGGGVTLGAPGRPILWYKPTGADKYRVIYADLSVKEAAPAEIKNFCKTPEGNTVRTMKIDAFVQDERHLIEMVRVYAAQQNGLLPPTLSARDIESGAKAPFEKEIEAKHGTSCEARTKAMQDERFMKTYMGLVMKCVRGLDVLRDLKPANDPHYAGGGVKLGTPDRPIFWYRPTGAAKYRVIYADLSVKEMAADEVKKWAAAKPK
jgi:outer membrane lipoprotein-sorting protein